MSQRAVRRSRLNWVKPEAVCAVILILTGTLSHAQTGEAPFETELRLRQAATAAPNNVAAQRAYAEFLDLYRAPEARATYARLIDALDRSNAPAPERAAAAQRLAVLDLLAGDRDGAT